LQETNGKYEILNSSL